MARGQESDPHRVMLEALEFRLRKLYPDGKIILGKKIRPVGLKPDLFIEHLDGRRWVYEMVYGNANAQHILENHQHYRDAGVHDFWILWDTLAPSTEPFPANQGTLEQFVSSKKRVKSNKLLQTLASIHSEHTTNGHTVLYAFALDGLNGLIENPHRTMQAIATGITIYQVENFVMSDKYLEYVSDYMTLMELDFDENGYIKTGNQTADEVLQERLLRSLGFEDQIKNFPLKFLNNLNQMLFSLPANVPEDVSRAYAEKVLADATLGESIELQEFINSGKAADLGKLLLVPPPSVSSTASLENAEGMQAIAQYLSNLPQAMENAGIPVLLRKMLMLAIDPTKWADIADVMTWQENSEAVNRIQNSNY